MNSISYISTSDLYPHPDNPRKDLGDLTELAESIRESGIYQNLTVVPRNEGGYTVIIGHRRLGAAKIAGLTSLPCIISNMNEKEQLATMMLENMQRSDLTYLEQAQGFQLMLDLGESIESIAKKTGISKSTVRNRVKLAKYDAEILKAAAIRQPTMEQYMRLSEIEDLEKANYVARFLGTKNFDREVDGALRAQREKKERSRLRELISAFSEKLEDASYEAIRSANLISRHTFYTPITDIMESAIEKLSKDGNKYFYAEGYGFTLYTVRSKDEDEAIERAKEKRRKIDELEQRANDIYIELKDRAWKFISSYNRKDQSDILRDSMLDLLVWGHGTSGHPCYGIAKSLGWEYPEDLQTWTDAYRTEALDYIYKAEEENICRVMLHTLWIVLKTSDICHIAYNSTHLEPYSNHDWRIILSLLEKLGYNVSDDEWAFVTGHHPIYKEEIER